MKANPMIANFVKAVCAVLLVGYFGSASAGSALGKVTQLWGNGTQTMAPGTPAAGGVFFFNIDSSTGAPACANATNLEHRFVLNLNTASARGVLATLLWAASSGKTVSVNGTGTCDVWGDTESVSWVVVSP